MMLWLAMIPMLLLQATAIERRARYVPEIEEIFLGQMTPGEPCSTLQKLFRDNPTFPYEEQTVSIALLWNDTLEYAAAALLRATLMSAGYNGDFIELYKRDSIDLSAENSHIMLNVEVPARSELQLQRRLTPRAARDDGCRKLLSYKLLKDLMISGRKTLSDCDFMGSEPKRSPRVAIYIVQKWTNTCAAKQLRHAKLAMQFDIFYLDDSHLSYMINNSYRSFFFLDTYQQKKPTAMWPVMLPIKLSIDVLNTTDCITTEAKKSVLLKYARGNNIGDEVPETFVKFLPSVRALSGILTEHRLKNQSNSNNDNMKKAACSWVNDNVSNIRSVRQWRQSAVLSVDRMRYAIVICKSEVQDMKEYLYMIKILGDYKKIDVSTFVNKNDLLIQTIIIDCNNAGRFIMKLMHWQEKLVISTNFNEGHLKGVVLTNEVAIAVAPFAYKFFLRLITYDVSSGSSHRSLCSATGSVKHLVLALRRLLGNCGWQRLAIISEPTQLAMAVSNALRAPTTLLKLRDLKIMSTSDIQDALQELLNADARVFLVNAGAATAAAILAVALELGLTRDKGFIWIVREYNATDYATITLRPYSVSFWWRGENGTNVNNEQTDKSSKAKEEEITEEVALRLKLDEKWSRRAWPLHAAPLLDALLTLINIELESIDDVIPRYFFWDLFLTKMKNISGISQNLNYDNHHNVISPLIFIEQWSSETRPRLLATWRGGEWPEYAEACPAIDPPPDGSKYCLLPYGDPFQPNCRERTWIPIILATLIGIGLVITVIYWSRKAFLAHNLRIKTKYAKRILARKERVFEALAEHLVDRKALEFIQELGTGRFGCVHQGVLRGSGRKHQTVVVAVKTLREDASSAEESEFLGEASMLATLDNEHIINFVGVCVIDGPPLLLMEHAFFGDLLQYLQARRCLAEGSDLETTNRFETNEEAHVSAKAITKLAQEAALALAYLAQRGIVHRDVRASNCLVDERRCLKLADFGLARATGTIDGEYQMCRRGLLPVLSMAPESLAKGVSSPASDVWSFGVLVFELVTLGQRPYGVQPPPVVLRHVVEGGRPQLPWDASAETRALTRACWRQKPEARPPAARLADWLSTRWRALRPALVAELVDIDSLMNDKDFDEHDLCPPGDTSQSESITSRPYNL